MQGVKDKNTPGTALSTAISHPLRARALTILADRVASSVEIARELGADLSQVSYHVRALREMGLVEEVGSRQVRGSVEHYMRAVVRPCVSSEEEASLPIDQRTTFTKVTLSVLAANASMALDAGTFVERADHHATRVPVRVDEQGWSDLAEAYMGLFERVYEIQAESAERLGADDPGIPAISFLALFEMPDSTAAASRS